MTGDPVNLNEVRAIQANDATLWTPLDCLKALVRDLESGECAPVDAVYVAMVRRHPENGEATSFPSYTAGAKAVELRGMLTQHISDLCESFRRVAG